MRILMFPLGTLGDVLPYVRLGRHLLERGHCVIVVAAEPFLDLVRNAGLDAELGQSRQAYYGALSDPQLWHPVHSFASVVRGFLQPTMRPIFERLRNESEHTVVLAPLVAAGARVAQECLGTRLVTILLQPTPLRSIEAMPRYSGMPDLRRSPRVLRRVAYAVMDRFVDLQCRGPVERFRREIGLTASRRPLLDWWFSERSVVGLFPDWFASPRSDWPPRVSVTGFPLETAPFGAPLPAPLERFLAGGARPVLFTFGTGMMRADGLQRTAIEVCRRLGLRGILLGAGWRDLGGELPDDVIAVAGADFSVLLPRCRAVVHHGGIGTVAEALRAGLPQVIVPLAFDQPDNGARIADLGVGAVVAGHRAGPGTVERALTSLLARDDLEEALETVRARIVPEAPLVEACRLIEAQAVSPSSAQ
jgi:rhamnosyltransferase subunit B